MSSIMKGLQGPMSEEMDDAEWDAMMARLKQKAAKQEKLKAQGKEPQTKQDPKTGKYYVDFDDEQVKETSSTGQGGGSAGIGGGAGLGIDKSPMEKILEKPLGEDTAYAGGGGQGGSAGQSYRKFKPKSAGVEEGKLSTALGAIGLGAMMAMNPAHADVKTSDTNVSKDSQTTTHTRPSAINYKQDKVYKAIQNALEDMHPKWDYNMLNQFSYHTYKNYKETGKLDSEIVNYYKVMQSDQAPAPGFSKKWDAAAADQVKETSEGWQDDERRRFKRQELQHELGREQSNNIQVKIDGRPWKVFAGRGRPDSAEEYRHLRSMKDWADKKSAATGKKWEVYLTGAPADVKENQQGLGEEQAPMFTPEAKMASANNPTGTGWRYYKAKSAGLKEAMPSSILKMKQKYSEMSDSDFAQRFKDKTDDELKAMAWRHGYGKDSPYYVNKRQKGMQGVKESAIMKGLTDK